MLWECELWECELWECEMSTAERARRLVGDMPWVTEHLTPTQLADLSKQIEACIDVAVEEAIVERNK